MLFLYIVVLIMAGCKENKKPDGYKIENRIAIDTIWRIDPQTLDQCVTLRKKHITIITDSVVQDEEICGGKAEEMLRNQ